MSGSQAYGPLGPEWKEDQLPCRGSVLGKLNVVSHLLWASLGLAQSPLE
jgi:hypothetical protein